jgi:hypothetical protein
MRATRHWQKTDPGLREHPHFLDLVAELKSTPIVIDGLLHGLWSMAFKMAPDGDLTKFKPRAIARAVGWTGHGDVMVTALVETGFLFWDNERLLIHDWDEWGGSLFVHQKGDAARQRRHRNDASPEAGVTVTLLARKKLEVRIELLRALRWWEQRAMP